MSSTVDTKDLNLSSKEGRKRAQFIKIYLREDGSFKAFDPKFEKGTTCLGLVFEEGIMIAVDHPRTSLCPLNVVQLNSHMLATISGGNEFLLKDLQMKCNEYELVRRREPSVPEVLDWLREALFAYEKPRLSVGILIAVWNKSERGLYRMNGFGKLDTYDRLATGSGSVEAIEACRFFEPVTQAANVCGVTLRSQYAIFSYTHILFVYIVLGAIFPVDFLKTNSLFLSTRMRITEVAELAKGAICRAANVAPHYGEVVSVYCLRDGGCERILMDDMEPWQKEHIKVQMLRYGGDFLMDIRWYGGDFPGDIRWHGDIFVSDVYRYGDEFVGVCSYATSSLEFARMALKDSVIINLVVRSMIWEFQLIFNVVSLFRHMIQPLLDKSQKGDCSSVLIPGAPCGQYAQGREPEPTTMCCDNSRQLNSQQVSCLCLLLNDNSLGSYTVNKTLARELQDLCSLQNSLPNCSEEMLAPVPPSSPTPQVSSGATSNATIAASPMVKVKPRFKKVGDPQSSGVKLDAVNRLVLALLLCLLAFLTV
ncbi:OLC1v1014219C1 [Oldenlandia corymbosa var. corymbosa]|uniref:OLC1v1014219C1 n=1 Tax=Oldenlandia corymbosa var. corymbosa TaxID=529605 RepID=A0AAV1E3I8_OLDCO|nr:OLC1v1014219C1 [Oldenlandia corymbosa var. corymbosa]